MSRISRRYLQPMLTDGSLLTPEAPKGHYTLASATQYFFIIPTEETAFMSVQITGYTAGLVLTSAKIQDTDHGALEVLDKSTTVGEWVDEDPTTGFVGVDGTGWSVTNAVVAVLGTGVGGAVWHVAETGAFRTRLSVLTGAAGGEICVSACGK